MTLASIIDRRRGRRRTPIGVKSYRNDVCVTLLLTNLVLGGCVVTPPTTPRETPLKADGLGLSQVFAPEVADTWWMAFDDSQLNALVDQALKGNPSLAAAMARVRAAQSELSAARAATYPQATFDGQEVRQRFPKNYNIPPPFAGTWQWFGTEGANLSWSLDFFGKLDSQIARVRASARAAQLDATAARLMLAGSVAEAYVGLWRAYVLVDVAQDAVEQRTSILSLTQDLVQAGLDTLASEKEASALLALAREDLTQAMAARELATHQIAALIGRGANAYDIRQPQLNAAALTLPAMLPADLLARRADVAAAQARVEAAFQSREIARKAYYPDINLIGLAGTAAIGFNNLFSLSSSQYGAGAAIHLPIFDAGELDAGYAGATASLDEAVSNYNTTVIAAVKDTADALTDLRSLENQAGDQKTALSDAQESFDFASERYRSGLLPQQTMLDAESLLLEARQQDAALAADTISARVTLLMAIGGGFKLDNSAGNDHE
jgi:NodT family efflux transporter outer membrane factor (OMF) lipoprotein